MLWETSDFESEKKEKLDGTIGSRNTAVARYLFESPMSSLEVLEINCASRVEWGLEGG